MTSLYAQRRLSLSLFLLTINQSVLAVFTPSISTITGSPFSGGTGQNPANLTYSPDGRFLTTSNRASSNISLFSVNSSTGTLTWLQEYTVGSLPNGIAYNSTGTSLAVANYASSTVSAFSVNRTTGALSLAGTYPVATAAWLSFSPNGNYLAVLGISNNIITIFKVNGDGTLSNSSNYSTPSTFSSAGNHLAFSPNGKYLATLSDTDLIIYPFNQTTGILDNAHPISVPSYGTSPSSVAWSPQGTLIGVTNFASNNCSLFLVDQNSGAAHYLASYPVGINPDGSAFSPDGNFYVVPGYFSNTFYVYTVNRDNTLSLFQLLSNYTGATITVNIAFSPVTCAGVSFLSAANYSTNNISSWAFSLMQPLGTLACAIRSKYLLNQ
jgi:6-phosphogluconolactonase (cycloisomerase 2 family)